MTPSTANIETRDPAVLAGVIHDDVLQSLGVAVLGIDLCRRFHRQLRYELALEEITGIGEALKLALASSKRLLPALTRMLPASQPNTARPGLVVMDAAPELGQQQTPAAPRRASGPREIVETLTACEIQARRCRGQYDAGLGEETMQDLELMLQRLEFASVAFRDVMGQLREQAGRPLAPRPLPEKPMVISWSRSA